MYATEFDARAKRWSGGIAYAGEISDLDQIADETRICVESVPRPYAPDARCLDQLEPPSRGCIQILATDLWSWSCDGREQLLEIEAPASGCREKGFEDNPSCPCRYRGGTVLHDGKNLIVVTPNRRMLQYELVRYWSGCWNAWYDERLAACAN